MQFQNSTAFFLSLENPPPGASTILELFRGKIPRKMARSLCDEPLQTARDVESASQVSHESPVAISLRLLVEE
jgi:hypothetical protein